MHIVKLYIFFPLLTLLGFVPDGPRLASDGPRLASDGPRLVS